MTGQRITLVADELRGIHGGGLGTVFTYLAIALARLGNTVDVLYFGRTPAEIEPAWADLYAHWGVPLHVLPPSDVRVEPAYFGRLLEIDRALEAAKPDVVIAQDLAGAAYVPLRRRQLGLGYDETLFIVRCSGTRRWITDAARKVRVHPGALAVTVLEQAALELADVVVAESRYMVAWMREQGWRLPDATHVIPSVLESGATGEPPTKARLGADGRVRRIVFFGRLEERKGVRPFVEALNALEPQALAGIGLEFMGATTPVWPPDRVKELLTAPFDGVRFTTGLDRQEALGRLGRPGTLAVMPSLEDNSPSTVYECLELGIPFIASAVGGTAELVAAEDAPRALFDPTPTGIAAALGRALSEGLRPVRAAFDDAESLRRWVELVSLRPAPRPRSAEQPNVEVIVTRQSEDEDARGCTTGLAHGSYDRFEVTIVTGYGARAAAARTGDAPWVVFLDARDIPHDDFLETLLRAQAASAADIVTCGLALRGGEMSRLFLGEPGALGLVSNSYGSVALVRRSILADEPKHAWAPQSDPDWPLLAHLSANGAHIVSVPAPLVTRRCAPGDVLGDPGDALLVVAALEDALPESSKSLARLAAGLAASASPTAASERGWMARQARRLRAKVGRS